MVARGVETFSTSIILIFLAIFVLHLIRGDAMTWLTSKFKVFNPNTDLPKVAEKMNASTVTP